MPSVRVRRSTFSQIPDRNDNVGDNRGSIPISQLPTSRPGTMRRNPSSSAFLEPGRATNSPLPHEGGPHASAETPVGNTAVGRSRSGTTTSYFGSGATAPGNGLAGGTPRRARSRTVQSIFKDRDDAAVALIGRTDVLRRGSNASTGSPSRQASIRSHGPPVELVQVDVPHDDGILETEFENEQAEEEGLPHPAEEGDLHHDDVVDHLDVVDPAVSMVSHLQNMTSGIMLPAFLMPSITLNLPPTPSDSEEDLTEPRAVEPLSIADVDAGRGGSRRNTVTSRRGTITGGRPRAASRASRISGAGSYVSVHEDDLDRHVVNVLRKRDQAKRLLRGLWAFLKTPMGIVVAFYGFNVVFWGAAIVFFLAKIINLHNKYKQDLWVEITSQVVNGLFTITGIGLLPFRIIDTYRMFIIWRLKRLSLRLRAQRGLPMCENPDDLPDPLLDPNFIPVLTEKQQATLAYQQQKFQASQSWYRPHATDTHTAFPISYALWNTLLMDGNSFFQVILCCCMWSLSTYSGGRICLRMGTTAVRPPWTTGCLIPFSFLCGIGAAVLIWQGGEKSKKVAAVETKLRLALGMNDFDEEGVLASAEEGTMTNVNAPLIQHGSVRSTKGREMVFIDAPPEKDTLEEVDEPQEDTAEGSDKETHNHK